MYKAIDVAEYVIQHSNYMSNLKLQKVLYFLQANHLVLTGKPLFSDEIEAVGFGPVVYNVYRKYLVFGGSSIPKSSVYIDKIYKHDKEELDSMIEELEKYSSSYLSEVILHQTPWRHAKIVYRYNNGKMNRMRVITHESLIEYFKEDENE